MTATNMCYNFVGFRGCPPFVYDNRYLYMVQFHTSSMFREGLNFYCGMLLQEREETIYVYLSFSTLHQRKQQQGARYVTVWEKDHAIGIYLPVPLEVEPLSLLVVRGSTIPPYQLPLVINCVLHKMELDMRASVTPCQRKGFHKLFPIAVFRDSLVLLRTYYGERLPILGEMDIWVQSENRNRSWFQLLWQEMIWACWKGTGSKTSYLNGLRWGTASQTWEFGNTCYTNMVKSLLMGRHIVLSYIVSLINHWGLSNHEPFPMPSEVW